MTFATIPLKDKLKNFKKTIDNPALIFTHYAETYAPTFELRVPSGQKVIVSSEADFAQHILQKNQKNYRKSDAQTKVLKNLVGQGLLTSEGPYWLKQRRLIQPGFHRKKLAELTKIMDLLIKELIESWSDKYKQNEIIDIAPEMMKITFQIVAKSLFSSSIDEASLERIGEIIHILQQYVVKQIRTPWTIPWMKLTGKEKYYLELKEEANEILLKIIKERKENPQEYNDLLDMLMNSRYEDTGEGMSNQQILDECLIIFVAGHETTANAMAWITHLLAKHPETQNKIREEAQQVRTDFPEVSESVRQLSYTLQTIEEAMRLYPPAWATDRITVEDDEWKGIPIPKNTIVLLLIYGCHRNPEYWENPNEFMPDRFKKELKKSMPSYAYYPFGGGPRLCIGNNFALMEMQLLVSEIVSNYKIIEVKNQEIEIEPLVTLRPKNGIKIKLQKL